MELSAPRFSVVIPAYNRAEVVGRAVLAVRGQSWEDFELLVVDDGSTDGTPHVVEALAAEDSRIRCVSQPNRGVSAARNLGVSLASGEVVTFLDSDDEADRCWLATLAAMFDEPKVGMVCVGARVVDARGEIVGVRRPSRDVPLCGGQRVLFAPPGTMAVKRELLLAVGGYCEDLRFAENSELAMRLVPHLLGRGWRIASSDELLVVYHRDPTAWAAQPGRFALMRDAAELILRRHGGELRQADPKAYADYCGVAAVNAARLGDFVGARGRLGEAIAIEPLRWRSYVRWLLAAVPPLARWFWRRQVTRPLAPNG
jgi:glycosyltransferase involved in cell wall biosynthesis